MKAKFGAIVVDGRGKAGGHVFSKNKGGAYMRTKVTPTNPNTSAQAQARSILASLSQQWSTLSDSQRLAWNNAVADYATTDIFGDIKNPSGINLYVKLNSNISNVGGILLSSPPVKLEMPSSYVESATYDISTDTLTVTLSDSNAENTLMLVRATPALSQGISSIGSQLRVIGVGSVLGNSISLSYKYASKFGIIAPGSNVYMSAQFVLESGQKSTATKVKVTVQA